MKSLMDFQYVNVASVAEAVSALRNYGGKARVLSGGSDLLGTMRFEILREYPEALINLKSIPGLDYITEEGGFLKIGALTRLRDIAISPAVCAKYSALAEAAHKAASPAVREMGTIAGNICQLNRCWYFRAEENIFDCMRKGGKTCYALIGENRYHSIFGASRVAAVPCSKGCPAGNQIPSYLNSIREDNLPEAARILLNSNPLPAITGRVCTHPCEAECNRTELDEALSIRSVERFVGDYMLDNSDKFFKAPGRRNKKKVAVVGSGPAGLSAAFYLRRLGYGVTIFEAREEAGGILTYGIPPYRLPKDLVRRQVEAVLRTGVQVKLNTAVGKDVTLAGVKRKFDAVFCATGAWKQPVLGLKGEELLTSGLEFLSKVNRGLRESPAGRVLVIGGGSVAFDVATCALRLGSNEVMVACLESEAEIPAQKEEIEQALKEGIKVMPSWGPRRVLKKKGRLAGMELVRCTSVFDSQGKFAPVYDESVRETIEADRVILAIGQKPDLSYAEGKLPIERGLIMADGETQATGVKKVFAGGDATISGPLSVVAAVASGRRAAESINRFLGGKETPVVAQNVEHLGRCEGVCFEKRSRALTPGRAIAQLSLDSEDLLGLNLSAVRQEADRCLNCGCVAVNPSDLAAALLALNARIVTCKRTLKADDFWAADRGIQSTVLDDDEIVTEIRIPAPSAKSRSAFIKFALRKSIDFPIVNCAVAIELEGQKVKSARICLNGVYNTPYRPAGAEQSIQGKRIGEASADAAGAAAIAGASALEYNKYKVQIARTLVKRAILACR
jgi:NADPH-dependent glutamate synthase beta subunit-like oxidoreductase/CO/xanthine dehydrogenase FAD-binding subunit